MTNFDPRSRLRLSPRGFGGSEMEPAQKRRLIAMAGGVAVLALVALFVWWPRGGGPVAAPEPTAGGDALGRLREAIVAAGVTPEGEGKFSGVRWEFVARDGREYITLLGAVKNKALLDELNEIVRRVGSDPSVVIDSKAVTYGK